MIVALEPTYISVPVCQVQTSSEETIYFPYYGQERSSLKRYHTSTEYCFIFFKENRLRFIPDRTEFYTI